jgi:hypothetical protein
MVKGNQAFDSPRLPSSSGGSKVADTVPGETSQMLRPCFTSVAVHLPPLRLDLRFHPAAMNPDQRQLETDELELNADASGHLCAAAAPLGLDRESASCN